MTQKPVAGLPTEVVNDEGRYHSLSDHLRIQRFCSNSHEGFLLILLERVSSWAKVARYPEIEQRATSTFLALGKALKSIAR